MNNILKTKTPQAVKEHSRLLFLLIFATLFFQCSSNDKTAVLKSYLGLSVPKDTVDAYILGKMVEWKIPGLSYALINDGEIVHYNNFGYANKEKRLPITDETIFEGASMSKSVFAFFTMTYVEEGKLNLDKPLFEYLPYPDLEHDQRYKKITARMVLSHTTGMPNWRENEKDKKLKLHFEPGTAYEYSGEAYQYLAMVLKYIENTDWDGLEEVFQKKIAEPIGLEHTVFIQTDYTREHKAEPYDENGKWINWGDSYWDKKEEGVFGAAYSIHSEPKDFAKWMIAVMNKELLTDASYQELLKPHSTIPNQDPEIQYTLGFFKYPFPIINTYGHGGSNEGFTCYFTLSTEKNWGYILFTNSEYGQTLGEELFFYLLAGPNLTPIYITGVTVIISVLVLFGLLIRYMIIRIKKKKGMTNAGNNETTGIRKEDI